MKSDETGHWDDCDNCDYVTEKEAHTGGTATTTEKAECTECGAEYGELVAEYTLTIVGFNPTADRWMNPEEYTYTATIAEGAAVAVTMPTVDGYTLQGYIAYDEEYNEVEATIPETMTADVTVFAVWTVNSYNTITLEYVDGTTEYVYFGQYAGESEDGKTVESIDSMYWTTMTDWNEEIPETFETKDYTFTEKAYYLTIVNYNPALPMFDMARTYYVGYGKYAMPEVEEPTAEGYTFTGYIAYDEDYNEVEAELPTMITEDVTVYATWTVNSYNTITLNYADGTTDYLYFGQYAGQTADGKNVESIDGMNWTVSMSAEWVEEVPETFEAKDYTFTEKTYTLTIGAYDPTADRWNPEQYYYTVTGIKDTAVNVEDPTSAGYTFAGYTDVEGNEVTLPATLTEDVSVFANWTIDEYTLTIVNADGTSTEVKFGVTYDPINGIEASVNDLGFVLEDNLPESDDTTMFVWVEEVPETFELKDYTFTIKETRTEYEFTIVNYAPLAGMRGSTYWTMMEWGTEIELEAPQNFTGATFSHYEDLEGNVVEIPTEMPKAAFTAYAIWDVAPYTLTINYPAEYEGDKADPITFGVMQDTENGIWDTVDSLAWIMEGMLPAEDEKYTYDWAEELPTVWELQNYGFEIVATKVEYTYYVRNYNPAANMWMGENPTLEITAAWGEAITVETPAYDGLIFKGYIAYDEEDNEVVATPATTMPIGGGAIFATWEVIPYTVTIIDLEGNETVTTFGAIADYSDSENPVLAIGDLPFAVSFTLPEKGNYQYSWSVEPPVEWALQNYEFVMQEEYVGPESISEALAAEDGANIEVSGTVCAINTVWNDTYNNISVTIVDAEGDELYLYRLATKVELGDIITVKGVMATYNSNRQVAAGATAEITGHDSSYDYTEMTIEDAIEAEDGTNVIVTGTVVKIDTAYSSYYNNISVYIADDNGVQLYLYRLTGNVEVNQIIKVTGTMATYSGARQVTGGTFEAVGTHTCANYTEATCKKPASCVVCGMAKDDDLADHNYVEGICSVCGATDGIVAEPEVLATFEFGENTTNLVADNNGYYGKDGSKITEESYTVDNYTLALTSCTNVYASGYDATGNATLKLGTSSKVGAFTFTVSEDVKSVEIVVTAYKKNTSKYQITSEGVVVKEDSVSGNSDNNSVEYTTIKIDTSVNKTFTFTTVSGGVRMLVASIIFIGE